jgi:hypothetical protein
MLWDGGEKTSSNTAYRLLDLSAFLVLGLTCGRRVKPDSLFGIVSAAPDTTG